MTPVLGTVVGLAPMAASPIGVGSSKKLLRGQLSFLGALAVHAFLNKAGYGLGPIFGLLLKAWSEQYGANLKKFSSATNDFRPGLGFISAFDLRFWENWADAFSRLCRVS